MQIRPAQANEAELLSGLAGKAKAHWGYSPETTKMWRRELSISAAEVTSRPVFVGTLDQQVVGFYSLMPSAQAWELDNLWVLPEFMHRGIGRALLSHALETAIRGGASSVTVDADPNAEAFYLGCGAIRRGEVRAPIPGQPQRVRPQLAFSGLAT